MIHDDAFIIVIAAACMVLYGLWCAAQEVRYRWQAWQRQRMIRWQRRVHGGEQPPPRFDVMTARS